MAWIAAGLLVVVGLLVVAMYRQGVSHQQQIQALIGLERVERSELLTRIQHPEVRVFPQSEQEPAEPPRDAGEMAFVGQIVPDGYHVGTEALIESANQNP